MATPTPQEIMRAKASAFCTTAARTPFRPRRQQKNGTLTAQQLKSLAECAEKYGDGHVAITSRLQVEMPGIHLEDVEAVRQFAVDAGLVIGGTGAKVRPLTACSKTTCASAGTPDTQAICAELYDKFYTGWGNVALPHKFKIAARLLPEQLHEALLNDFGIEAHRLPVYDLEKCRGCKKCLVAERCPMRAVKVVDGKAQVDKALCNDCGVCIEKCPFGVTPAVDESVFAVFVGGTWGKHTRMGTRLSRYYKRGELDALVEKTILWFRENAFVKERLGAAIDRVGVEAFEAAIATDDLLLRKDAILAAPLKERQA